MSFIKNSLWIVIIMCVLFTACMKNTDVSVGGSIHIQPEYAIPIGSPELELGTYLNALNNLNPIDTMQLDTIEGFIYDSVLYEVPKTVEYRVNVPFTLSGTKETDEYVTAAVFRTNAVNKIPAEIMMQVYLIDIAGIVIDSFYTDGPIVIPNAIVNNEGYVTNHGEIWEYDMQFREEKLDKLTDVASIEIYNKVIIQNVKDVLAKYYSDQDLWLQLAVRVSTDLKLND